MNSLPPSRAKGMNSAAGTRPEPRTLRAGPLLVQYENGALRYIRCNGTEVLRMIYSAVRDYNWGTVAPSILSENITEGEKSFSVELEVDYRQDDIHFSASYCITGTEAGIINFSMQGHARSSFKKNRIGICVLHPINECAGKPCEIERTDGKVQKGVFPERISPHQPFRNIRAMRWHLPDGTPARLRFEGDVFETEDQRNWTDASYKTYCTPLDLPFPVLVAPGARISQSVELSLEEEVSIQPAGETKARFYVDERQAIAFPKTGVARSSEVAALSARDIGLIRGLHLHHYRVDVKLFEEWEPSLIAACTEALALGLPLEIFLQVPAACDTKGVEAFAAAVKQQPVAVYAVTLSQRGSQVTPGAAIAELTPLLRGHFPAARIGGGTDAYFAELNRNPPAAKRLDYLSFSINPQVHAFDDASLVENLETQGFAVDSARRLAPGKAIHVSPVTLKPRFNPSATGPEPAVPPGRLPPQADLRQPAVFAAAWTLGSLKYLAEAGAESITYFETAGTRGLLMPSESHSPALEFPSTPGEVFPVYYLLREVLGFSGAEVLRSKSSAPLQFDGLVLRRENTMKVFLVNFQDREMEVTLAGVSGKASVQAFAAPLPAGGRSAAEASPFRPVPASRQADRLTVTLEPGALVVIDVER